MGRSSLHPSPIPQLKTAETRIGNHVAVDVGSRRRTCAVDLDPSRVQLDAVGVEPTPRGSAEAYGQARDVAPFDRGERVSAAGGAVVRHVFREQRAYLSPGRHVWKHVGHGRVGCGPNDRDDGVPAGRRVDRAGEAAVVAVFFLDLGERLLRQLGALEMGEGVARRCYKERK